jgi:hypothetical protein
VRYHGVLAPNSPWRRFVVPRPPPDPAGLKAKGPANGRPMPTPTPTPTSSADGDPVPNVLSAEHWARLSGGRDLSPAGRVDWATLLRRTFAVDVLECAACGGRMTPLEVVTDPEVARAMLVARGLDAAEEPLARARAPTVGPRVADLSAQAGEESQVPPGEFSWAE